MKKIVLILGLLSFSLSWVFSNSPPQRLENQTINKQVAVKDGTINLQIAKFDANAKNWAAACAKIVFYSFPKSEEVVAGGFSTTG